MSKDDIEKAVKNAEAFAEEDKKKKEEVDTKNNADSLVFQCEKALGEFGDKVSADEKSNIETKINALKEANKGTDIADIKTKTDDLQKAFYEVSSKVYQAASQQAQSAQNESAPKNDDVVDADFKDAE